MAITKKDRWGRNDNNNQCNSDLSLLLQGWAWKLQKSLHMKMLQIKLLVPWFVLHIWWVDFKFPWWPVRLFQMAIQPILVTAIRGETDVLAYFSREDIFQKMPSQHFEWVAVKGRLMLYTRYRKYLKCIWWKKIAKLQLAPDRQRAIAYVDSIARSSFVLISVVHCLFLI